MSMIEKIWRGRGRLTMNGSKGLDPWNTSPASLQLEMSPVKMNSKKQQRAVLTALSTAHIAPTRANSIYCLFCKKHQSRQGGQRANDR